MRLWLLFLIIIFGQSCSHVFYQPSRNHYVDPAQFNLKYKDIYFESKDGTKLHGWFFPAQTSKPKGTIVQFHGNAQNISTHFFSLIWIIEQGYNLFTFDYRGYGKSAGSPSQEGIHLDALAALDFAKEFHHKSGKGDFVVYGQSLGGAISLRAIADWEHQKDISLIVMDSTFGSYKDIAFDKLTSRWFLYPVSPLAFVLVSDSHAPEKVLNKIHQPTLVVVGMKDEVVPAKFGKEIYKTLQTKKWLWELPNGRHIDSYHHENEIYRQKFMDFLDRNTQD